jgi:RNA polymerase sigma-70 factor (ECF subfamily)
MLSEHHARHLLQHREVFLAFVRRRVADPELAADVLQDSLLKALKHGGEIPETENLTAWFYRILRHSLIDLYRRQGVRERALQELQMDLDHPMPRADEQALCACLHSLLPAMKPEYAELIRGIDLGEESLASAASRLGVSANNLRVRLHRARRQLRARLLETCRLCAHHGCLDCDCADAAAERH